MLVKQGHRLANFWPVLTKIDQKVQFWSSFVKIGQKLARQGPLGEEYLPQTPTPRRTSGLVGQT